MNALFAVIATLYALAFASTILYGTARKEAVRKGVGLSAMAFFFFAWLSQGIGLSLSLTGVAPSAFAIDLFQVAAWTIALSFLIFSSSTRFLKAGTVFSGVILLFLALSAAAGDHFPVFVAGAARGGVWAFLHLFFSYLAFALLTVSSLIGTFYLFKEFGLKHKRWSLIEGIPPLDRLYRFFGVSLWIGFLFLTVGLLSGGGWSKILFGVYLENDVKEGLTLLTWTSYALIVNVQVLPKWRGKRAIAASMIAFVMLVISVFGVMHTL